MEEQTKIPNEKISIIYEQWSQLSEDDKYELYHKFLWDYLDTERVDKCECAFCNMKGYIDVEAGYFFPEEFYYCESCDKTYCKDCIDLTVYNKYYTCETCHKKQKGKFCRCM